MPSKKQNKLQFLLFLIFVLGLTFFTQYLLNLPTKKESDSATIPSVPLSLSEISPGDTFQPYENHVFIPRLRVQAPILTPPKNDRDLIEKLMEEGVVHDLMSAPFGYEGNSVLFGHSSHSKSTPYSNIFSSLVQLQPGDKIEIFSEGTRYFYQVEERWIVDPKENWITEHKKGGNFLTLYTCFPPGKDTSRLTFRAKLIDQFKGPFKKAGEDEF